MTASPRNRREVLQLLRLSPNAAEPEVRKRLNEEFRRWTNRSNAPTLEARTEAAHMLRVLSAAEKVLQSERPRSSPASPGPSWPAPGRPGQSAPERGPRPTDPRSPQPRREAPPGSVPRWDPPPAEVPWDAPPPPGPWNDQGPGSWSVPAQDQNQWPSPRPQAPSHGGPEVPYQTDSDLYYQRQFALIDLEGGSFRATWNWAAFFFMLVWYLYRGMWAKMLIMLGLLVVTSGALALPLCVYAGVAGNDDYYLKERYDKQMW